MDKVKANKIFKILSKKYPKVTTALDHKDPLELLVATILSAQCTDKRVNIVTKTLFKKYLKTLALRKLNLMTFQCIWCHVTTLSIVDDILIINRTL